jgi:hypothetical protein
MDETEHGTAIAVEDQVESVFVAAFRPRHHARRYFRKRHPYFSVNSSSGPPEGFIFRFLIFHRGYRIVHRPLIIITNRLWTKSAQIALFLRSFQFRPVSADFTTKVSWALTVVPRKSAPSDM